MERLNQKKLDVLVETTAALNRQVEDICAVRPDVFAINREEWKKHLEEIRGQIHANQMILFIGPFSSGKSSFINALLGEDILPTSNRPCTSVVTELSFVEGGGHRGRAIRKDYQPTGVEYDYAALLNMVDGPSGAIGESAAYHHIELEFDITQLQYESACLKHLCAAEVKIVDCPGYGSPYYSNDEVIEEYISKASHTFWINPVDRMGSGSDYKRLSEIRKKTTTLIPVMSKSDLIDSESKREEICESYSETIGALFRSREPIFCSAVKYREGQEIEKKIRKEKLTGDALKQCENERDVLYGESGLSNVCSAVIDSASERSVTDAKVNSVCHDLKDLVDRVRSVSDREFRRWQKELKDAGFDEGRNAALEDARKDVELWIEGEADRVGRRLDNMLRECVQTEVDSCSGNVNRQLLLEKVIGVWKDGIAQNVEKWGIRIASCYNDKLQLRFDGEDKDFKLPVWLNASELVAQMGATRDVVIETIKDSGLQTLIQGGVGFSLLLSTSAIATIKFVGGTLAGVAGVVGGGLVALAAISAIPIYAKHKKAKDQERRRELELKINKWLGELNMGESIRGLLMQQNDMVFKKLEKEQQKVGEGLLERKNMCENVLRNLERIRETLSIQFANVK